jgi:hypothetical protein
VPTNQSRKPATIRTVNDPENSNHGDCLNDFLDLDDHGKNYSEIDPGQGNYAIWKEQILRIYFQNINGIRLKNDSADMIDTC